MSKLWTILLVLNLFFIYYNGLQDAESSSQASERVVEVTQEVLDRVNVDVEEDELSMLVRSLAHVIQYLSLGLWATLLLISMKRSLGFLYIVGFVILSDEFLQTFAPGRAFELSDIGLNLLGFSIGVTMIYGLYMGRKLVCAAS